MRRFLASAAGAALFLGCISNASDTQPQPQDLYFRVKGTDCYACAYGVTEYKGKELYDYVFFGSAESAAKAYLEGKGALEKALDERADPKICDKPDPQPYSAASVFVFPEGYLAENAPLPWVSALDKDTLILFMKTKPPVLAYRREVFEYAGSERPESTPDQEVQVFG